MAVVITSGYVLGHQRSSKKMMAGPPPASGFRTSRVTGVIRAPRVLGEQTRLTCPGVREAAGGEVGELEQVPSGGPACTEASSGRSGQRAGHFVINQKARGRGLALWAILKLGDLA